MSLVWLEIRTARIFCPYYVGVVGIVLVCCWDLGSVYQLRGNIFYRTLYEVLCTGLRQIFCGALEIELQYLNTRIIQNGRRYTGNMIFGLDSNMVLLLTIFVAVSLPVEFSIHRFSYWLQKTNRKPSLEAVEKMREELMLLRFISLLLKATPSMIANICIPSKFYNSNFSPCLRSEIDEEIEK